MTKLLYLKAIMALLVVKQTFAQSKDGLRQKIEIQKKDLLPDLYSPIRDK